MEKRQAEQLVKVAITQAAQAAKIAGKLPGDLARMVAATITPKVDWRAVLREFVETSSRSDYTWTRPNRRYLSAGFYLPSLDAIDQIGRVVVAVDTSGSVGDDDLRQFAGEISAILDCFDCTVSVFYADTAIRHQEEFTRADLPLRLQAKGGGGTRFRPVFDHLTREGEAPACLIYLTDLEGNTDFPAPDYPVLWIVPPGTTARAAFGQVVEMHQ